MNRSSLFTLLMTACVTGAEPKPDYPLQPVPLTAVRVDDGFWSPRLETNRRTTVWYDFKQCEDTGRIDNFAKAGGLMPGEFRGTPWDDSDVYKVIEGAAYTLATRPDPKLDKYLDELIAKIAAAQEADGYLYTARRLFPPDKMPGMSGRTRWSSLVSSHELYNVGHLYEAAVAHFQATGKRSLLDVALRNADFLCETFGPGKVQSPPGHQEIEIGLAKLCRVTGRDKYLKLAKYLLDIRGRAETHGLYGAQQQDHLPVLEQAAAVGHAVRAGYMYAGMADVAALTGDAAYVRGIDRLWEDVVACKLHLTGGIGAGRGGEAFGGPYDLPNGEAYLETCAAIANALWNHRMFLLHGEGKYIDVLERVIYNGFLSGVALSGDRFFYPNPLEHDGGLPFNHGRPERAPWFDCSCCPVNVVRFIPSLAGFIHATRGDELYVNLFIGGEARARVGGTDVVIRQQTRYPWDGRVTLTVEPAAASEFTLRVRIPGWARNEPVPGDLYRYDDGLKPHVGLAVNGQAADATPVNGYARIKRTWHAGDTVTLDLEMPVRRVQAHAMVKADRDRFAVERGPLVYCAEGVDNGGKVLERLFPGPVGFKTEERPELLGGTTVLRMTPANGETPLTLIPYHLWCHRGPNQMRVWFPFRPEIKSASHCGPADNEDACFDGAEPKNSGDPAVPRFTWWDHRGTAEWVVKRFERPTRVSGVAVYWFDDTGAGECRVPAHWKLLYRDGDEWKPVVATGDYGVARDQYNKVTFAPVTTAALRIEAQLQPGFSAGVLEWKWND
ncbi:MAG: glycoside hydrolase family 127 protein [Verrucomicrobia bacterium]|nr:glycoside hydrolase family 127 protein [Verrucomicrobiota bacterium]